MAALNSKVKNPLSVAKGLGADAASDKSYPERVRCRWLINTLIQYVVNECIAAGITEIVLVTHSSKKLY